MAISKKIKLYVSDSTGERKTSKYYRIPLKADTLPFNSISNLFKDLVRAYAKITGDRIYISMVTKYHDDLNNFHVDHYNNAQCIESVNNCKLHLPTEFLNDGEINFEGKSVMPGGVSFTGIDDVVGINAGAKRDSGLNDTRFKAEFFTVKSSVVSDTYNDLTQIVPSTWEVKESLDDIITEVNQWLSAPDAIPSRGPKKVIDFSGVPEGDSLANGYVTFDPSNATDIDLEHNYGGADIGNYRVFNLDKPNLFVGNVMKIKFKIANVTPGTKGKLGLLNTSGQWETKDIVGADVSDVVLTVPNMDQYTKFAYAFEVKQGEGNILAFVLHDTLDKNLYNPEG